MIKYITLLPALLLGYSLSAQTFSIAEQSISTPSSLEDTGQDRFGAYFEPPPMVRVERVQNATDTFCIISYGYVSQDLAGKINIGGGVEQHTIPNHPIFNDLSLDQDSLMKSYPDYVEWVGFEKSSTKKKKQFFLPIFPSNGAFPASLVIIILMSSFLMVYLKRSSHEWA
jgi:hypothetical protein